MEKREKDEPTPWLRLMRIETHAAQRAPGASRRPARSHKWTHWWHFTPLPSFLQGPILYGLGLIGAGWQAWKEEARF